MSGAATGRTHFDAIVIGGGHNGLVSAAYLAKAGLKVVVLESRAILGGPVGTFEFLPGSRTAFTNSPGSFEHRIMQELDLATHGLRFIRPDPTLVHGFGGRTFIGWRDRARTEAQLDAFSPGEAARYAGLLQDLEQLAKLLGFSIYRPAPDLDEARSRLAPAQAALFDAVFYGSLRDLLNARLQSDEAKTLLGMVALNVTMALPSEPGTAAGLMLRPIGLASGPDMGIDDPRRSALRGSTGLPEGGMGAIIDALERSCRSLGVDIRTNTRVTCILHDQDRVIGLVTQAREAFTAPVVMSAINPRTAVRLLAPGAMPPELRDDLDATPLEGSAFKLVLALDRVPRYAGLPNGLANDTAAATQFRIAASLDHVEAVIRVARQGRLPDKPPVWGLIPTLTSPQLAPAGRHMMRVNVWHAPYVLADGQGWSEVRDEFAERCIDTLAELMPKLRDCIVGVRAMTPMDLERELDLERSHITHGDMLTRQLFGARPHRLANDYRTPLKGFYLSGSGDYVTGVPGLNASTAVLSDRAANGDAARFDPTAAPSSSGETTWSPSS